MSIVDFLLARIAEDEAAATFVIGLEKPYRETVPDVQFDYEWARITKRSSMYLKGAPSPSRVLAECAAKRCIVNVGRALSERLHAKEVGSVQWHEADAYNVVIHTLAAVYKDHPDYQERWAV